MTIAQSLIHCPWCLHCDHLLHQHLDIRINNNNIRVTLTAGWTNMVRQDNLIGISQYQVNSENIKISFLVNDKLIIFCGYYWSMINFISIELKLWRGTWVGGREGGLPVSVGGVEWWVDIKCQIVSRWNYDVQLSYTICILHNNYWRKIIKLFPPLLLLYGHWLC